MAAHAIADDEERALLVQYRAHPLAPGRHIVLITFTPAAHICQFSGFEAEFLANKIYLAT